MKHNGRPEYDNDSCDDGCEFAPQLDMYVSLNHEASMSMITRRIYEDEEEETDLINPSPV